MTTVKVKAHMRNGKKVKGYSYTRGTVKKKTKTLPKRKGPSKTTLMRQHRQIKAMIKHKRTTGHARKVHKRHLASVERQLMKMGHYLSR